MPSRPTYEARLEKGRSPELTKLLVHIQCNDFPKSAFTIQELAHLGVTAIALPDADSLLSTEEHFRPTQTFGRDINEPLLEILSKKKKIPMVIIN